MNFKTGCMAILVLSIFLLSGCEVYQTLYGSGSNATTGNVVAPAETETMEEPTETPEEVPEETEEVPAEEVPEVVPVRSSEKPVVVVVQETDLVNLVPKAEDPDKDATLVFTFTSPLDEDGEWQTTYGDSGEYTITVTVSDGELATSRDVLIIVNKKEETPTIDGSKPIESSLTIDEGQSVDFSATASDLNDDPLDYEWKLDGDVVGTDTEYTYQSDYDSAGTHTVKFEVGDGLSSATKIWSVDVRNVNRKPVLEGLDDIEVKETDIVTITAMATDDDNEQITYSISDSKFKQDENVFSWETDYDSAGTYEVTVSASDGHDTTEEVLAVVVANVNRPPVITDVTQK